MYYRDAEKRTTLYKALDWFSKSSALNYPWATIEMAHLYAAGLGVDVDLNKAFALTQQAVLGDIAQAEYELAEKYETGSGTSISLVTAGMWYRVAVRGKYKDSTDRLSKIESQLSPAELETEKESRWRPGAWPVEVGRIDPPVLSANLCPLGGLCVSIGSSGAVFR